MKIPFLIDIEQWIRFFRKHRPVFIQHARLSYSQFGEDLVVQALLGEKTTGFWVDVGAYHPFMLSNTCLLSKKGWRGINIEPNPDMAPLFRKYRKRDINLTCAVAEAEGETDFIVHGGWSGIAGDKHTGTPDGAGRLIRVPVRPLRDILSEHVPADVESIDLLNVDCEGYDLDVLRSNDWDRWRPRIVLVEDYEANTGVGIGPFLEERGYTFYCRLGSTSIYRDARDEN